MSLIKVLKSNSILSADFKHFFTGAVVIENERIVEVIAGKLPAKYQQEGTKIIDFGDKTIVPGFIESHAHIFLSALVYAKKIFLVSGHSEKECAADLASQVQQTKIKLPGGWIVGKGWYLPQWTPRQLPTKNSLDQVFPDQPVVVIADDLHTLWLNSAALKRLLPTADPQRYQQDVHLDENDQPDGLVGEQTAMGFLHVIFNYPVEQQAALFWPYLQRLASYGLTTICDLALLPAITPKGMDDQIYPAAYQRLAKKEHLPLRVNLYPYFGRQLSELKEMKQKFTTDQIRIAGAKLFFDGVTSSYTAWMRADYEQKTIRGAPNIDPQVMRLLIFKAQQNQIPLRIHTIGDQAIHQAILDFKAAIAQYGPLKTGHHCLEHLETIDPSDIPLMKENDLTASIQPSHPLLDYQTVAQYIGQRAQQMWPFATFYQQQVPVAFGTDSPVVTNIRPLQNIYFAITRQTLAGDPAGGWHPQEKLDLFQALQGQTLNAAKACSQEQQIGSLQAGKQADICILNRNLEKIPVDKLKDVPVLVTISAGKLIYQRTKTLGVK
ncbi:amidohydrolase [Liquorilactobacillus sicerae]|uniref:amidohydrolase n=1 Tax=Liquorilactobacillus sicerae TaxID=1416943 RepID=UPI0024817836|nr:amidohydrolase [Liquorilactobacillus sicerae]